MASHLYGHLKASGGRLSSPLYGAKALGVDRLTGTPGLPEISPPGEGLSLSGGARFNLLETRRLPSPSSCAQIRAGRSNRFHSAMHAEDFDYVIGTVKVNVNGQSTYPRRDLFNSANPRNDSRRRGTFIAMNRRRRIDISTRADLLPRVTR